MVEYEDETEIYVPFEIGLQAGETVPMWAFAVLCWLLSLVFMGLAIGFNFTVWGITFFIAGGLLVTSSQLMTSYNPMTTMRFPLNGLLIWLWTAFLSIPIAYKGWEDYLASGTDELVFFMLYGLVILLATVGLLLSYYLTSMKILKWMNQDIPSMLFAGGVIAIVIGITDLGFNSAGLLDIEEISIGTWIFLFLFSLFFILFIELNSGAHHFNEIISYAKKQNTTGFNLTPVINNYYIMGFILMVIIAFSILVVFAINFLSRWITPFISGQMADSIMMNSVYSVVFTVVLIFVPLSIILTLFFSYKERREEEEEEEMRKIIQTGTGN